MTDVHSPKTRSYNMSRIRGKNTRPELLVRKYLFARGFRFKLHDKQLNGKPDIVLPKYKTAIFINGCFWHGHKGCRFSGLPKSRSDWWEAKICKNIVKLDSDISTLQALGWKVIVLWTCQLKPKVLEESLQKLKSDILLS